MKDLAAKTIAGIVPTREEACKLSDDELVERLVSVRGIGAWTVEMFLIFNLGRPDVLPDPRSRRKKRLVGHLRQETHAQAERTPRLRRTMAPLSHHRQLVHVASLRTRRLHSHQQNPPPKVRKRIKNNHHRPQK